MLCSGLFRLPFRESDANVVEWNSSHGECDANLFRYTFNGKVFNFDWRCTGQEGASGGHDVLNDEYLCQQRLKMQMMDDAAVDGQGNNENRKSK